jgi:hypothetical protein
LINAEIPPGNPFRENERSQERRRPRKEGGQPASPSYTGQLEPQSQAQQDKSQGGIRFHGGKGRKEAFQPLNVESPAEEHKATHPDCSRTTRKGKSFQHSGTIGIKRRVHNPRWNDLDWIYFVFVIVALKNGEPDDL